jgi:hypothetical protein
MATDPYTPPSSRVADPSLAAGLEVTWGRAAKVWWSMIWRAVLFGGLGGAAAGFVLGVGMGVAGASVDTISRVTSVLGLVVGIPIGIWVVRNVLGKSWSDFRIVLVPPR